LLVVYIPQQETEGFLPQTDFSLGGTYMEPLAPFASRVLFVSNMRGRQGHMGGHQESLTGWSDDKSWHPVHGPSLDQYVAGRLSGTTPLRSLELTIGRADEANKDWGVVSWSAENPAPAAHPHPAPGVRARVRSGGRAGRRQPRAGAGPPPPAGPQPARFADGGLPAE
jgi:hypothetical protein